jgi:Asp-tRNA(Asn)/Glu-tRNA(Gln) amidotransferase A subunit family amidase
VRACVDRALSREDDVHAWAYLNSDRAITEAREGDATVCMGPPHGVPVAIKDVFDVVRMPATYGSPIYKDHYPVADASSVAFLRAAGGVIMGKTAAVEFSASNPTATRNPRNLGHTPGGSSSGSAAATADLHVAVATGAQTGGSVIRPAAYCGIVGFKPGFGTLCLAGAKMCAWSLDTLGVFARHVADATVMHSVLTGTPPRVADPQSVSSPRIGVFVDPFAAEAENSVRSALADTATKLGLIGASVKSIGAPPEFERALKAQRLIARFEMSRSLSYEWTFRRHLLSERIRQELAEGWVISTEQYHQAQRWAQDARSAMDKIFDDVDIILTLAATGEAPRGLSSTGQTTFNASWTLLGTPCLCLPVGSGPRGLPVAVQLIGRFGSDERFLECAAWVERVLARPVSLREERQV